MKRLSDFRGEELCGGRITELSLYKGDTYKLELESGQTFFLNCALVADYDLHEGGEMDADLLGKLQHADKLRKAKKRALYLLGSRMYCWNELYKKLLPTYGEEASRAAADAMQEYGYIDDEDYARKLAQRLIHGKRYGMGKTRWEMQRRGLDRDLIEDVLEEYSDDDIDREIMHLLETKYSDKLSDPDDRRRTMAALARRGYGWSQVKRCMERLELSDDEFFDE
ncbi:MAG: RecX family transcriptional regulator [Oscillospiraceae bacterium]|nr:RecX family transcriptional regulator [Oscillospiraceae bacterium]